MTVAFSRLGALSLRRVGPNCAIGGGGLFLLLVASDSRERGGLRPLAPERRRKVEARRER